MKPKFVEFTVYSDEKIYIDIHSISSFRKSDSVAAKNLSEITFGFGNSLWVKETVEEIRNLMKSYDLL